MRWPKWGTITRQVTAKRTRESKRCCSDRHMFPSAATRKAATDSEGRDVLQPAPSTRQRSIRSARASAWAGGPRIRRQRGIERNGDAWCLARVGVDPVIQPTGKNHEQTGLRGEPEKAHHRDHPARSPRPRPRADRGTRVRRSAADPACSFRHPRNTLQTTRYPDESAAHGTPPRGRGSPTPRQKAYPPSTFDPALASIIWRKVQLSQLVRAATAGSRQLRKSGRECHPPMLLRPRLEYFVSSARMSVRKSRFIARRPVSAAGR